MQLEEVATPILGTICIVAMLGAGIYCNVQKIKAENAIGITVKEMEDDYSKLAFIMNKTISSLSMDDKSQINKIYKKYQHIQNKHSDTINDFSCFQDSVKRTFSNTLNKADEAQRLINESSVYLHFVPVPSYVQVYS